MHALPEQTGDAILFDEHAIPQPPQFPALLVIFTSQPSTCLLLSQSAKPALQVPLQTPLPQFAVMFDAEHTIPQPPQLDVDDKMLVSQPLFLLLSQSAKPALHTGLHALETQLVVPLAFVHAVPQAPQFVTELVVLVSQPLMWLPSQSP